MLAQAPTFSVPVLREMSQIFRRFTTGMGNPGFIERNIIMDTKAINTLRPSGSVYGADFLANKAMSYAPQKLQHVLAPFKNPALGIIRTATTSFDPIPL